MFGAILGDYLGSVFEKIPHKPQRTIPICTDDSFPRIMVISVKEPFWFFLNKREKAYLLSINLQY